MESPQRYLRMLQLLMGMKEFVCLFFTMESDVALP